jgi:hypothetical protein
MQYEVGIIEFDLVLSDLQENEVQENDYKLIKCEIEHNLYYICMCLDYS